MRMWLGCLALVLSAATGCRSGFFHLLEAGPVTAQSLWEEARNAHTGGQRVSDVSFFAQLDFPPGVSETMFPGLAGGWRAYHRVAPSEDTALMVALHQRTRVAWAQDHGQVTTTRDGVSYAPFGPVTPLDHLRSLRRLVMPWDPSPSAQLDVAWLEPAGRMHRIRLQERDGSKDTYILDIDPQSYMVTALEFTPGRGPVAATWRDEFEDFRMGPAGITAAHRVNGRVALGPLGFPHRTVALWDMSWNVVPALPVSAPAFP